MEGLHLTDEQREAIAASHDFLAIEAAAGAGKTTTLVLRSCAFVASGEVPADKVLVLAFTRAAVANFRARLAAIGPNILVLTIHALCLRVLETHAKEAAERGILPRADFLVATEQDYEAARADASALLKKPRNHERVLAEALRELHRRGMVTMDEILSMGTWVLQEIPGARQWTHVLVDEAQDLSEAQWTVLDALGASSMTVVGDPMQAIMGFMGASPDRFRRCIERWPTMMLTGNFRSTPEILQVANKLLESSRSAVRLTAMLPESGDEDAVQVYAGTDAMPTEQDEFLATVEAAAEAAQSGTVCILARYRAQVQRMQALLESKGIPYWMPGASASIWRAPSARLAIHLLRASVYKSDPDVEAVVRALAPQLDLAAVKEAALREGNTLLATLHGLGNFGNGAIWWQALTSVAVGDAEEFARMLHLPEPLQASIAYWSELQPTAERTVKHFLRALPSLMSEFDDVPTSNLCLSTIHGAKGGEWQYVFVTGLNEHRLPGTQDIEGERRLLYVAITRAQEVLVLSSHALGESLTGRPEIHRLSPFVAELGLARWLH